jgi:hypothetical protein
MGVPTSEVGYTSATTRKETTKSMTDMWWHGKTTTTTINMCRTCNEEKHYTGSTVLSQAYFLLEKKTD